MRAKLLGAGTAIAICAGLATTPANATVIFTAGNNPQSDFNLLLNTGTSGNLITGTLNNSANSIVDLSSTQSLSEPANGQARVTATTGDLTNLNIFLPGSNSGFASLIANINADGTGAATISATNQFGVKTTFPSFSLGNGQNFFTLTTADNQIITSVSLMSTSGAGFTDVRQIRLGAVSTVPLPPAALMFGGALLGLGMLARRKRKAAQPLTA